MKKTLLRFIVLSAVLLSCCALYSEEPSTTTISIDNFSFMGSDVTVPVGTTVTWINHDDVPHNVVSTENKFKSKPLDTDEKFSFTFTEAGTYPYFCSIHSKMVAKVIVTPKK